MKQDAGEYTVYYANVHVSTHTSCKCKVVYIPSFELVHGLSPKSLCVSWV